MPNDEKIKQSIARAELEIMEKRINERVEQMKSILVPFRNAGSLRWLINKPPLEKFLFYQSVAFHTSEGFLPKGLPCMLISPGVW